MKTCTKCVTISAIAVLSALSTTPTTQACSVLPPADGCHLTSLRATNDPYIVQGKIERHKGDEYEERQVFIDLRSESIITNTDERRQRGLRTQNRPSPPTPQDVNLDDIEIAPFPVPQPPAPFSVMAKGSRVTIKDDQDEEVYRFELREANYKPEQGDTINYFYDEKDNVIWVFYTNNYSYWGGVQVNKVNLGENPVTSYTLGRESWNESGDAFFAYNSQGEIPYYPDLKLATLHNSGAMCGGVFALYNNGYSLRHQSAIQSPLLRGFDQTPVYYAQTQEEDSAIFTLSGGDDNSAHIEKVSIRTGQVTEEFSICHYDIAVAGGCPAPRSPRRGPDGCPVF